MDTVQGTRERLSSQGWSFRSVDPPVYSEQDCIRVLDTCRTNYCGMYGTTWACPPGWTERMDSLTERYGSAILMTRRFEGSPTDKEFTSAAMAALQDAVRSLVIAMRGAGTDCIGFADDACGVCPECAYPGPCRHPDLLVPSIAAAGVDMGNWFSSIGEEFIFEKDAFTMYGVILYVPPEQDK